MKRILMKLARRIIPLAFLCAFLYVSAAALENPFSDVRNDAPYYDAVMWALETHVTAGTSATAFSPAATCNRGQVVTFLWRAAGQLEPSSDNNPFSDVGASSFCYKAVLWAVQQEITNGTSDSTFSPGNPCTYAHVLTFLWRSTGSPSPTGKGAYAGSWYADALAWADESGILNGASFTPTSPCPRSDIVSFLYRWARPASLSRYPYLAVDRIPIPESELQGSYRSAELEFIVELQGAPGDRQELLFLIQNAFSGEPITGCQRAGVNFYLGAPMMDGNFAVGFSRVDGVIYLDCYYDDVHLDKIPRASFEDAFDDSDTDEVWMGDYVGSWIGADGDARYELTIDFAGLRDDVEYCKIHLDYRGRLQWDALCAFNGVRSALVISGVEETDEHFNKYTGESEAETVTRNCQGVIALQDDGSLWINVTADDGSLKDFLEDIDGRFVRDL